MSASSGLLSLRVIVACLVIVIGLSGCHGPQQYVSPTQVPVLITITGTVTDSWSDQMLAEVHVRLTTTEDPVGTTVTTGGDGRFVVSAMSLPSRPRTLQLTREGYFTRTQMVPANESSVALSMTPQPATDFSGEFLLTLVAAAACTDLPVSVRSRTYQAALTGGTSSPSFRSKLSGAPFIRDSSLSMTVRPDVTSVFIFDDNDFDDVDALIENLNPGAFYFRGLTSTPTVSGNRSIDAPFDGHLGYCPGAPSGPALTCNEGYVACDSQSHRLILTPR